MGGYTIHHEWVHTSSGKEFCEGQQAGVTSRTMWHGALEPGGFRRAFPKEIARLTDSGWRLSEGAPDYVEQREAMIEEPVDVCEDSLDVPALLDATKRRWASPVPAQSAVRPGLAIHTT